MAAPEAGAAGAADGVQLIDEDDARRPLLGRSEQLAHPGQPHPDEYFDEFRPGDGEERHLRLAGERLGQHRLARPRRSHEEDPSRHLRAEPDEAAGIAQVIDELLDLALGVVLAGDVGKPHARDLRLPRRALEEAREVAPRPYAPAEHPWRPAEHPEDQPHARLGYPCRHKRTVGRLIPRSWASA